MVDVPDNLVLQFLRRLDEKVDRITDDMQDLKHRMTAIEIQIAGQSARMDRIELRLDRIERRLELAPAP
jgi:predicted  nucleic acid-binding Zn-ribbon protein